MNNIVPLRKQNTTALEEDGNKEKSTIQDTQADSELTLSDALNLTISKSLVPILESFVESFSQKFSTLLGEFKQGMQDDKIKNTPKENDENVDNTEKGMDNIDMNDTNEKLNSIEKENIEIKADIKTLQRANTDIKGIMIGIGAILLAAMTFSYICMHDQMNANTETIKTSLNAINQRLDDQYKYIDAKTGKH